MAKADQEEHFYLEKLKKGQILEEKTTRRKTYERKALGLKVGDPTVSVLEHTIPLEQNTAVIRIGEYLVPPELVRSDKPSRTLLIIGGGGSPGLGSNLKLGIELLEQIKINQQKNEHAPKTDIARILFLPNPSGSPRDKIHQDVGSLSESRKLLVAALAKLGIDEKSNISLYGYLAGGALAIEIAAYFDSQDQSGQDGKEGQEGPSLNRDLILLDPTSTIDYDVRIMKREVLLGNFVNILRRLKAEKKPLRQFPKLMWQETLSAWATLDGVPNLPGLIKDFFKGKQRHLSYASAYGLEAKGLAHMGPDIDLLAKDITAGVRDKIKGNVLIIELGQAQVVNQPATRLYSGETNFPHASRVLGVILEKMYSHSFAMDDDGRIAQTITDWFTELEVNI